MQTAFPFDAGAGANVTEDGWAKMAALWRRTGVIAGALNKLAVTANGAGMQVTVDTGQAWVNGFFYENDAALVVPIGAADPANPRIDRVALRLDRGANTIAVVVIAGAPAPVPAAPALQAGNVIFDVPLAQVRVDAAVVSITAPKVTDERTWSPVGGDDEGLLANRGAANHGRYYWASDDRGGRLWRGDGASWFDLGPGPVTGPQTGATALIVGHASAATSDTVLSLRGKVGQSGDLLRASDPTGATDLLRVGSDGALSALAGATVRPASTGGVGLIVNGLTGQTADLVQAQVAGTVKASISPAGRGVFGGGVDVGGSASGYAGGELRFTATSGEVGISSLNTGTSSMDFDHRGAGNTGFWAWRNGTGAALIQMTLSAGGVLKAVGEDHWFGSFANGGGSGTRLHVGSLGTTTQAFVIAEGAGADVDLVLRPKGGNASTRGILLQTDGGTTVINVGGSSVVPKLGFFGAAQIAQPGVTGSRAGNVALANLLNVLASLGLIVNSTSA